MIIGAPSSRRAPQRFRRQARARHLKGSSDSDVQLASPGLKPSDSDVTLIKEDTADHGMVGSGSSSDTSVRVSPLRGFVGRGPVGCIRQRLRAQSFERADRRPSARLGQRFRAERLDASDEFEATPLSKAERFRRDGRPTRNSRGSTSRGPAIRASTSRRERARSGPGRLDRAGPALSDEEIRDDAGGPEAKPSKPKPSLAATPPAVGQEGRERHLRRHRLRSRRPLVRRRFRRQDRSARSRQRLRPGRQRHRLRGLRHR